MEQESALLFSLLTGIGLSAACGFRIFVPFLVMNVAHQAGYLSLSDGWEWIGSTPALIAFITATLFEVGAYYIPVVDNFLDAAAAPAAVVAGTLATASQVGDMHPFLGWSVAVVAGGGAAGVIQGLTTITRQFSTLATAGFGNPIFSTVEAGGSIFMTILAIFVPFLAAFGFLALAYLALSRFVLWRRKKAEEATAPPETAATAA